MALNIPEPLRQIVVGLFDLKNSERQQLLNTLKEVEAGSSVVEYEKKLKEDFPEYSTKHISMVLRTIFSIANLGDIDRQETENIAEDFIVALQRLDDPIITNAAEDSFVDFKKFVAEIIDSQDVIALGAKATRLMSQYERIFVYPEIFSDIRSVFPRDTFNHPPKAAIVVHSLKIHSLRNGDSEDIFFAMDVNDLKELQSAVQRALEKHHSLSSVIESANMKHVKLNEDE